MMADFLNYILALFVKQKLKTYNIYIVQKAQQNKNIVQVKRVKKLKKI